MTSLLLDPATVLVDASVHSRSTTSTIVVGERRNAHKHRRKEDVHNERSALVTSTDIRIGRIPAEHVIHEAGHVRVCSNAFIVVHHPLECDLQVSGEGSAVLSESKPGHSTIVVEEGQISLRGCWHRYRGDCGRLNDGSWQRDNSQVIVQAVRIELGMCDGLHAVTPFQRVPIDVSQSNAPPPEA